MERTINWFAILSLIVAVGCFSPSTRLRPENIYIFSDRSDAELEYRFFIKGDQLFVSVCKFPEYSECKWYLIKIGNLRLPTSKGIAIEQAPPHFWYAREVLSCHGDSPIVSIFIDKEECAVVKQFITQLRKRAVQGEYGTDTIPAWIEGDPRIDKRFGLGGKWTW